MQKQTVPEWRPKYVQYKQLKSILDKLPQAPPEEFDHSTGTYKEHSRDHMPYNEIEMLFLSRLDLEIIKVTDFYNAREKEALMKKQQILAQLHMLPDVDAKRSSSHHMHRLANLSNLSVDTLVVDKAPNPSAKIISIRRRSYEQLAKSRIKKVLLEFYRSLDLLKNFKTLNYQAIVKIMKKFDKQTHRNMSPAFIEEVKKKHFVTSKITEALISNVENLYRRVFTGGDRSKALRELRIPDKRLRSYQVTSMASGVLIGLMLAMIVSLASNLFGGPDHVRVMALIYAGLGLPVLLALLFAINTLVWEALHINYKFIFEFDHRQVLHNSELSLLICTFSALFLGYVYASLSGWLDHMITPLLQPWVLICIELGLLLLPLPIFYASSRFWMVKVLVRIFTAPLYPVRFHDFFVNDQLMSLGFTLQTLSWLIHLTSRKVARLPLIQDAHIPSVWYAAALSSLPAFWRIVQSFRRCADGGFYFFPHMANLIKYAFSFAIPFVGLGIHRMSWMLYLRLAIQFTGSVYALIWDICMDFGLVQGGRINGSLRETLLFPSPYIYYGLMAFDFVFRILWVFPAFKLIPNDMAPLVQSLTLAVAEVIRRFVWNFFRVEYEQVNNCNSLRAYADIPLPYSAKDLFYQDMVEVEIAHHHEEEIEDVPKPEEIIKSTVIDIDINDSSSDDDAGEIIEETEVSDSELEHPTLQTPPLPS